MKKIIIGISFILIAIVSIFSISRYVIENDVLEKKGYTKAITLSGEYNILKKQVDLKWNTNNSENYIYKCYQKKEGATQYQTISSTSFEEGDYIKVLNVYPGVGNNLAGWMNNYGMGIISVSQVTLTNFNNNPTGYMKNSNGSWKYDVLVFGFWDCNNSQDLTSYSASIVESFINDGNGCIFGHDTISLVSSTSYLYHPYFSKLAKYVNITNRGEWTGNNDTNIYINKTGIFTSYPWEIGKEGTHLTIPQAHNLDQTAYGDIWIKFNNNILNGNQNFYLTTWNNCAMIQTGHSNGLATVDEQKILANLIFYVKQLTSKTYLNDYTAMDLSKPDKVSGIQQVIEDESTISIKYSEPKDYGNKYAYYVEGIPKLDNLERIESNSIEVNAVSGIKGYSYVIDNSKTCTNLDSVVDTTSTSFKINRSGINWGKEVYLHIAAVDNAGNMSEIETIKLIAEDPAIYYYYIDNSIILRVTSTKPFKEFIYPDAITGQEVKVTMDAKKNFAVDYNVESNKSIDVKLTLNDGTEIKKTLYIEKPQT